MNEEFKKRIQKTMCQEIRQMRKEKRQKSGFYSRIIFWLLIFLIAGMSLAMSHLNALYNNLIEECYNKPKTTENLTEANFEPLGASVEARITFYKPTGHPTASGKTPKNGMVATSDRNIPFGTEIYIDGEKYIVEDRTAWYIEEEKGFTVDIFMEEGCDKNFGADKKLIIIK